MKSLYNIISYLAPHIPQSLKNMIYSTSNVIIDIFLHGEIHQSPIIILANHKTGTTAIAVLLSTISGLSLANGVRKQMVRPCYNLIRNGEIELTDFLKSNRVDFSKEIIKENLLTFCDKQLFQYYQNAQFVFIVRDPRDNIRSILNRLAIPGDLRNLPDLYLKKLSPTNRFVVDNKWLGISAEHYIQALAERWNVASTVYLEHQDKMQLLRYEDFLQDKEGEITRLAQKLSLPVVQDISSLVDIQYQPKGDHSVNWINFFGDENLAMIEKTCGQIMQKLGYENKENNE